MRRGVLAGIAAYGLWGLFPLFWPLLKPAGAVEILAHRMVWSLVVMALVVTVLRRWRSTLPRTARVWWQVAAAAVLISVNWGLYIYAVNNGHVIEASLGYFVNPLFSVLIGVLFLGERLRPVQWAAVTLGAAAVLVISLSGDRVPYIALGLACSFGLYGLVKKLIPLTPTQSLTSEGVVLVVPALATIAVVQAGGTGTLTGHGAWHIVLLVLTGLATVVPLWLFGVAAQAIPLSLLGLIQYLTPVMQFLLGVLWAGEQMPTARWVGFALVWVALMILSADALRRGRRSVLERRAAAGSGISPQG